MGLISFLFFQLGPEEQGPSLLDFFWQSGPMAKFILALLVLFSLGSWAVMIGKAVQLNKGATAREQSREPCRRGQRFSEVNAMSGKLSASPLVGVFQAGSAEIDSQLKHAPEPERPGARQP